MKIKVSEATDTVLDYLVAKAEGHNWRNAPVCAQYAPANTTCWMPWSSSTDWSQGGPIIEREKIAVTWDTLFLCWRSQDKRNAALAFLGPTPLIAAMRCFVASRLGDEVEVPGELV